VRSTARRSAYDPRSFEGQQPCVGIRRITFPLASVASPAPSSLLGTIHRRQNGNSRF